MSQFERLSAEQVLQDIAEELRRPSPLQPPTVQAIAALRRRQQDFRASPVLGGLMWLKRQVFNFQWSTFAQQFEVNDGLIAALDDLNYELTRQQATFGQRLAALEQAGVQPANPQHTSVQTFNQPTLAGLAHLLATPAEMQLSERLLLYSLIYSLQPATCLEIGTFRGGSARLIVAALDDLGAGRLIAVDPAPKIATADMEQMAHRLMVVAAAAPAALAQAARLAGQPFDFALIDGDHSYQGALQDIEGVLPYLNTSAYLLLHDCYYPEVAQAITQALHQYPTSLTDCGILSVAVSQLAGEGQAEPSNWGGLHLLRYQQG